MPSHNYPAASLPLKSSAPLDMLSGIRVLDLTTSIAGPYATQLLADLGATVVKVERPGSGDDCRAWGPPFLDGESLWYLSVNRNKHSVTLDFATERGQALLGRLVANSDVVISNLVPRAQTKLKLDYANLRQLRDGLIHVSITGFGLDGARADMACYDLIAEGYSGVMDLTGEPDSPPQKIGTPAADMLAGHDAAMAVTAALFRRARDGRGCQIDISMVESMTRFLAPRILPYLGSGEVPRRSGGRDSVIAIYQVFDTADLPMTLGLGNDAIWERFWTAVGEPQRAADPAHRSNAERRAHRVAIVAEIARVLQTRPRAHWLDVFAKARVPAGPINRVDEVAQDVELHSRGFLYAFERNGCRVPQVGLGIHFDGRTEGCAKPPPRLGEDNATIYGDWLGLSQDEIVRLRDYKII
ncbi:CaiB/BaiF CoA transferase family protein [Solimonas soli]|uniref:CaiB/BaiF CoA transferase family protein n=1 Tax=Solimonas soli TaxID=413479 RepID=UPI000488CF3C|nr:CoA transferase [Solimonas soli]